MINLISPRVEIMRPYGMLNANASYNNSTKPYTNRIGIYIKKYAT